MMHSSMLYELGRRATSDSITGHTNTSEEGTGIGGYGEVKGVV